MPQAHQRSHIRVENPAGHRGVLFTWESTLSGSSSGKNIVDFLLFCPLPEILHVDLFSEADEESPCLFCITLALPELCGGEPVDYQVFNPHNSYCVGADMD